MPGYGPFRACTEQSSPPRRAGRAGGPTARVPTGPRSGGNGRLPARRLVGMGGGVDGGEFGADLVGVGVLEFVEDGQGLLPGTAGGVGISGIVVGVAEVGEGGGFVVAVAKIPEQGKG